MSSNFSSSKMMSVGFFPFMTAVRTCKKREDNYISITSKWYLPIISDCRIFDYSCICMYLDAVSNSLTNMESGQIFLLHEKVLGG